jgi:hypothetical protein
MLNLLHYEAQQYLEAIRPSNPSSSSSVASASANNRDNQRAHGNMYSALVVNAKEKLEELIRTGAWRYPTEGWKLQTISSNP